MNSYGPGSPGSFSPENEARRRDSLNDLSAVDGDGEGGDTADEASTEESFAGAKD